MLSLRPIDLPSAEEEDEEEEEEEEDDSVPPERALESSDIVCVRVCVYVCGFAVCRAFVLWPLWTTPKLKKRKEWMEERMC